MLWDVFSSAIVPLQYTEPGHLINTYNPSFCSTLIVSDVQALWRSSAAAQHQKFELDIKGNLICFMINQTLNIWTSWACLNSSYSWMGESYPESEKFFLQMQAWEKSELKFLLNSSTINNNNNNRRVCNKFFGTSWCMSTSTITRGIRM